MKGTGFVYEDDDPKERARRLAALSLREDGEPFAKSTARNEDAADQRARHEGRFTAPKAKPRGTSGGD